MYYYPLHKSLAGTYCAISILTLWLRKFGTETFSHLLKLTQLVGGETGTLIQVFPESLLWSPSGEVKCPRWQVAKPAPWKGRLVIGPGIYSFKFLLVKERECTMNLSFSFDTCAFWNVCGLEKKECIF